MNKETEVNETNEAKNPTAFDSFRSLIAEVAQQGDYRETVYTEGHDYTYTVSDVKVTINDSFSYWQSDMGAWSGIEIGYTSPDGARLTDRLTFVGSDNDTRVEIGDEPRRLAVESDLKEFESFLLYANYLIEEREREKQEKINKARIVQGLHDVAAAVFEYDKATFVLERRKGDLSKDDAKLANELNDMDEEEMTALLSQSRVGGTYSPYQAGRITASTRRVIKDILDDRLAKPIETDQES
jgi:hypothetical protein